MIHFKNMTFSLAGHLILNELNHEFQSGTKTTIIGRSGSGKSILLKVIAGVYPKPEGLEFRQKVRIGMLFQKNALFDSLTVLENLTVPLKETTGLSEKEQIDRAMTYLEHVGLESSANLNPSEISGGMQKRLGIARSLLNEPELLLLDEPTSGLDPIYSLKIEQLILKLQKQYQFTLITVTHDPYRALQLGDEVLFMDQGKLSSLGPSNGIHPLQKDPRIQYLFANIRSEELS